MYRIDPTRNAKGKKPLMSFTAKLSFTDAGQLTRCATSHSAQSCPAEVCRNNKPTIKTTNAIATTVTTRQQQMS